MPHDPVDALLNSRGVNPIEKTDQQYQEVYKELNLDLPSFYFSLVPNHYPENLNSIALPRKKALVYKLLKEGYSYKGAVEMLSILEEIKRKAQLNKDDKKLIEIEKIYAGEDYRNMLVTKEVKTRFYYPRIYWHGLNNQYHRWVTNIFNKGMGISIVDGLEVWSKISKALKWTLSFTIIDFFLSLFLAILVAYFLIYNPSGWAQRYLKHILYFLYSIPVFWMASLFVLYFTTDDYGSWTNIFPSVGIDIYPGESTYKQIWLNRSKLILPVLCLTLHSLAYIVRFLERGMGDELNKPYVLTAYSKGLTKGQILRKHVFRNALVPLITVMAKAFAATFSGSLVLEIIFNIPGMGRLMIQSIASADWNVVFGIVLILGFVSITVFLIADVLYVLLNPKKQFSTKTK